MRAVLSLIRAWLYGIVAFLAMTASLVLALSIAIAGPPTNEEMTSLGRATSVILERAGVAADRLAVHFCEEADLCGDRQTASVEEPAAPISGPEPAAPPALREPSQPEPAPPDEQEVDLALAGSRDGEAPIVSAQPVRAEPAPRRVRPPPRRRSVRAPAPPPIAVERRDPVEQLAERVEEMLAQVPAAFEAELGPDQNEQTPQADPYEDDGWWDEDEVGDEPPPDDPSYERETF